MSSALIHPVGWSQTVGHKLHASHGKNMAVSLLCGMKQLPDSWG